MNIVRRVLGLFSGMPDPARKSVISRRFVIAISVIFSALILAMSIAFNLVMHVNAGTLRETLEAGARDIMLERTELILSRLRAGGTLTPDSIADRLRDYNAGSGRLLAAVIFTKTPDENYFRTAEIITLNDSFTPELEPRSIVRQEKEINYLKKGLLQGTVDPSMYLQDGFCWQNAYYPLELGRKKGILQLMMNASSTRDALERYENETRTTRIVLVAVTILLVLAVILLSVLFLHNYSLLLGNLSRFMGMAAGGDLNVSLRETGDLELDQLAQSFNTLIEEMKDLSARPAQDQAPAGPAAPSPDGHPGAETASAGAGTAAGDETGQLFSAGVALLKQNQLADAIALFRALTIVKPQGFGSWFNLGVAHAKNREYEKAIRMFEEARGLNPAFEVTGQYIEKIRRLMDPDA